MISKGRHQSRMELVVRVRTFLNTTFFSPLGSFLYPILVFMVMNTKKGWLGSAFMGLEPVFKIKGFYLSAMDVFCSKPAVSSSGYSSELNRGTLTSEVTALFTTSLTIFMLLDVSSNIFLQEILGTSILKINLILCSFDGSVTITYPRNSVCCITYLG